MAFITTLQYLLNNSIDLWSLIPYFFQLVTFFYIKFAVIFRIQLVPN